LDPRVDPHSGAGPNDPDYKQEATVPLSSETHAAEEVAIYAVGPKADYFHGTVNNSFIFHVMAAALGLQ
jgi:alkaline phosphatase